MIRILSTILLVTLVVLLGNGCGSDDSTNPTPPAAFTRLVAAHHQNPGLTSVHAAVWDSVTGGSISVGADTTYNANIAYTTSLTAQLQALVSGDSLFIRVRWNDNSVNNRFGDLHAKWVNHMVQWELVDTALLHNEDRLYVLFDDAAGAGGCSRFCHKAAGDTSSAGRHFYGTAGDVVDIWHWKAHRTGLAGFTAPPTLGFAEDMHLTDTRVTPDPQTLANDSLYYSNLNQAMGKPRMMHQTGASFTGPGLVEGAWVGYTESGQTWVDTTIDPPVGKFVPGYYMYDLTRANGSRWDVRALAEHDGTQWTVVLCRKLNTGDAADFSLSASPADSVAINLAFGNNSGVKHHGYKSIYLIVQ